MSKGLARKPIPIKAVTPGRRWHLLIMDVPLLDLSPEELPDEELVIRVLAGERALYRQLLRRHNQKLFRAVRAVLRDDADAEDVVQHTWVTAFRQLAGFRGEARFSTWLLRIGVNEAASRLRARRRHGELALVDDGDGNMPRHDRTPEDEAASAELGRVLERHIDELPDLYRTVFVLRDVEELDTRETAICLGLTEETVRVRLHRARHQLQQALAGDLGAAAADSFRFDGARCDRIVALVEAALGLRAS
jgi:RNA polymerase sigma-70 factor (ECF subfamily)